MLSKRANELHAAVEEIDALFRCVARRGRASLVHRQTLLAWRNHASRQWGAEIQREQFEAHDRVPA